MAIYYANSDENDSDVVILGIPFDSTTSFKPGSRFGPNAIRQAAEGLESYSIVLEKDIMNKKICDVGDISQYSNPEFMISEVYNKVKSFLSKDKFVIGLGGEHTVTYGIVKAYKEKFKNLAVIQFDAHADLRDDYKFEKFSHACVMNLIGKYIGFKNIYQFGIRSAEKEEYKIRKKTNFYPFHKYNSKDIIRIINESEELKNKEIYITIDIDVIDPSFAPGTGTPEPGGFIPIDFFEILYNLKKLNVVGFDIVEINPMTEISGITSLLGAKILREGILSFVKK